LCLIFGFLNGPIVELEMILNVYEIMYDYNKLVLICKHSITMKCDDIKAKIRWLCDICFRKDQNNTDDELSTPL